MVHNDSCDSYEMSTEKTETHLSNGMRLWNHDESARGGFVTRAPRSSLVLADRAILRPFGTFRKQFWHAYQEIRLVQVDLVLCKSFV